MAKEFGRAQRIGDYLKRELAGMIQMQLRDPRIGMVGVNDVKVSRDMAYADIYVTVLGKNNAAEAKESIDVLNKATGFLRTQIAKDTTTRTTPKLRFHFDVTVSRAQFMSDLIEQALASDRQHSDSSRPNDD
jgi:ribosome-binding factor A